MRANVSSRGKLRPALLLVLVIGFVVALQVSPAFAAIAVSSTADGTLATLAGNTSCDLREAVQANNLQANVGQCVYDGTDAITLSASVTLDVNAGQLVILRSQSLSGGTVNGGAVTRVFLVGSDTVNETVARTLTLSGVTVTNGQPNPSLPQTSNSGGGQTPNGGCILVRPGSTVVVTSSSSITNCTGQFGGGIYGDGPSGGGSGGAVITVTGGTTMSGNSAGAGGAIYSITGTVNLDGDSTLTGNFAGLTGGGIHAGDDVQINLGGNGANNRAFLVGNGASNGGGIYMEQNSGFLGIQGRFYNNTSTGVGSAWLSLGGSQTRSCTNCCIVNNNGTAVGQTVNTNVADWRNNWWGSDFGPYVSGAGPNTASGTSTGDAASNINPFTFLATGATGAGIQVSSSPTPNYGSESTGGNVTWLRIADSNVPTDCINDICTVPSTNARGSRVCTYVP